RTGSCRRSSAWRPRKAVAKALELLNTVPPARHPRKPDGTPIPAERRKKMTGTFTAGRWRFGLPPARRVGGPGAGGTRRRGARAARVRPLGARLAGRVPQGSQECRRPGPRVVVVAPGLPRQRLDREVAAVADTPGDPHDLVQVHVHLEFLPVDLLLDLP